MKLSEQRKNREEWRTSTCRSTDQSKSSY